MKMPGWAQGVVSGRLMILVWIVIKHQGLQLEKPLEEYVRTWQDASLAYCSGIAPASWFNIRDCQR